MIHERRTRLCVATILAVTGAIFERGSFIIPHLSQPLPDPALENKSIQIVGTRNIQHPGSRPAGGSEMEKLGRPTIGRQSFSA